jgi:hypothetical protein
MTVPKKGAKKIVKNPKKLTRSDPMNERVAAISGARI